MPPRFDLVKIEQFDEVRALQTLPLSPPIDHFPIIPRTVVGQNSRPYDRSDEFLKPIQTGSPSTDLTLMFLLDLPRTDGVACLASF